MLEPTIDLGHDLSSLAVAVGFTLIELRSLKQRAKEDPDFLKGLRRDLKGTLTKVLGRKPTAEELKEISREVNLITDR